MIAAACEHKLRVLIVDDNNDLTTVLQKAFTVCGRSAIVANDARRARPSAKNATRRHRVRSGHARHERLRVRANAAVDARYAVSSRLCLRANRMRTAAQSRRLRI